MKKNTNIMTMAVLCALLFMSSLARAGIEWQTNDDEMTGARRAIVFLTTQEAFGAEAMLGIRIDSVDNVWCLYIPSDSVQGTSGRMLLKFDDEDPMSVTCKDVSLRDVWKMDLFGSPIVDLLESSFVERRVLRVQVRTSSVNGVVDRFSLMGFTRAYRAAMAHVAGGSAR